MSDNFEGWMHQIGGQFTHFNALQEGFVDIKFNVFYAIKNAFMQSAEDEGLKHDVGIAFSVYRSAIRIYEEYIAAGKRAYGKPYKASIEEAKQIFADSDYLEKSIADNVEKKLIEEGFDLEEIKNAVEKIAKYTESMFERYLRKGRGKTEQEFVDSEILAKQSKRTVR